MKIVVVIPAYNEENKIAEVIRDARRFSDEVIVVDDGSSDSTFQKAQENGAKVFRHFLNRGQGAALQTGNSAALASGADIIVHFDADGQFVSEEIPEIIKPIMDGEADIVFGSRFLGKKSEMPFLKEKIIMPLARLFNRIFLAVRVSDPQAGFRALTRSAAEKITIENDGMAHCSEIMAKACVSGLRIKEIPITVRYDEFGQGMAGGFRILREFFYKKLTG